MEGLVMAAGSAAGGLAAKAIMGKPTPLTSDTSIPGIANATVKKGGKDGAGEINAAQVDPSGAINFFSQAAQQYQKYANQGLNLYDAALQQGIGSINDSTGQAKLALTQMITQGQSANDEYMKMLGLAPASKIATSGFSDQVGKLGDSYNSIVSDINNNESLTDPAARTAAQQKIVNSLQQQGATGLTQAQQALEQAQSNVKSLAPPTPPTAHNLTVNGQTQSIGISDTQRNAYNQQLAQYQQQQQDAQTKLATAQAGLASAQQQQSQANDYATQYQNLYTSNPETGYTGRQAEDKLQATPGYQFQLQQGNQAVARLGLQGGMLNSGNTAAAAQEFGQGLANQTYQQYLSNLQPMMNTGNQASGQLSQLYQDQGQALAQMYGNLGTGALNTYQNIGNNYANAYNNAGGAYMSAATFNANAQNQAMDAKRQQDAQQQQQNVASGAGYLNAATNAAQFNYGVFQKQQGGQQFYNGSGGNVSSGAGTGFPYYNSSTRQWSV